MSPPPVVFKSMSFESAPAPPSAEALAAIGPRLAAGALDLLSGSILFVLTAAAVETFDTSDGIVVRLDGAAAWLWIALVLLSSFLAEALNDGRTIGKALLGLRVVRAEDGGRPSAWALAVRTVLRLVDGLPLFYGLGALLVVTTPNRQRLGDLVARTVVVRSRN